jgi:endoglucanase
MIVALVLVTTGLLATDAAPAQAAASGWLSTKGAQTVTSTGTPYTIKSTSWFGMETSNCAPHGLWSITLDAGLAQIASWGFNTIRLPFSNECLAQKKTTSISAELNPKLASLTPLQLMDAVVSRAKAHGLNVILDRHRPDSTAQSELWYTSTYGEKRWIDDWKSLATRYKSNPTVIGFDLHNEPRGTACWGCGDTKRDWRAAATRAGNAVLAINPKLLIIVQGIEKESDGSTTWWGGGLRGVRTNPVTLTVANRVVYSPHDYPSSVAKQPWFSASNYPANLESVWEKNWGYIQTNKIAPVLLGEFGTKLLTKSDKQWLQSLVGYVKKKSMSFAYWSFNPNSGDTGGLVKDDWVTPQQAKLDALAPILGTTTKAASNSPQSGPRVADRIPAATPTPSVIPSMPTPTATPSLPVTTPAGGNPAGVVVEWLTESAWADGYVAQLTVTGGTRAAETWSVSWSSPGATAITSSWGLSCSLAGSVVTCTGYDWAGPVAAGQVVGVGLQVAAASAPASPRLTVTSQTAR